MLEQEQETCAARPHYSRNISFVIVTILCRYLPLCISYTFLAILPLHFFCTQFERFFFSMLCRKELNSSSLKLKHFCAQRIIMCMQWPVKRVCGTFYSSFSFSCIQLPSYFFVYAMLPSSKVYTIRSKLWLWMAIKKESLRFALFYT